MAGARRDGSPLARNPPRGRVVPPRGGLCNIAASDTPSPVHSSGIEIEEDHPRRDRGIRGV